MKILIAGDFVISPFDEPSLSSSVIDKELSDLIQAADYSIVNFEAPVKLRDSKPIEKSGPNIHQPASSIDLLKTVGFQCVTLANNHFRDYGDDACLNTINLLKLQNIDFVGGGKNLSEASSILYKAIQGVTIAVVNICEQEWSIATDALPGSNPVQPIEQFYQVREAREKADFVIIIHHGGVEGYQLPSPNLKKLHRFFIDAGADAVINHHQHCISGYEVYNGKPIFYGLGNFLFNWSGQKNSKWNYGYMIELNIDIQTKLISFEFHPYEQCNGNFGVCRRRDIDVFFSEINMLNEIISDDEQLRENWNDYMAATCGLYKLAIMPYHSRILRKLFYLHMLPSFMSKAQMRYIYNIVNCDSHRVRFLNFLQQKIK